MRLLEWFLKTKCQSCQSGYTFPSEEGCDESLNDGDEGATLARSTESVPVEPENSSRGGAYNQQHKHPLQDAETSVYQQDGVPGEYWNGHERVEEGQIRCDDLRGETNAHLCRKRRRLVANRTATMDRHSEKSSPSWKFTQ